MTHSHAKQYRLVTRSDFDGLVCAVLLQEFDLIGEILFVHPKDMQDGKIEIRSQDITTNLPYVAGCYLAFDHHSSEIIRVGPGVDNYIIDPKAMSAARVVYNYYGGKDKFPAIADDMMDAVDKCDAAQFSFGEILNPKDWVLLSFLMDARTGLGRFRNFRISNYQLMMDLISYCRDHSIADILALPDVKERVDLYFEHEPLQREQIKQCATVYNNLVVLDLRKKKVIYAGNRFTIYALYPDCDISIHILWRVQHQVTIFAVGKSIIDRGNQTDIGALMLRYGGGGHRNAGTCQIEHKRAQAVLQELIAAFSVPKPISNEDADCLPVNDKLPAKSWLQHWMPTVGIVVVILVIVLYLTVNFG